ncbi:MAG TPA: hypothetical protein VGC32_08525 [Solirubrobacterales bacterium]
MPPVDEVATLVVCDGDQPTLDMLCEHLANDKFTVLPATTAADALRLCRLDQPDILILDLALPDLSGMVEDQAEGSVLGSPRDGIGCPPRNRVVMHRKVGPFGAGPGAREQRPVRFQVGTKLARPVQGIESEGPESPPIPGRSGTRA